MCQEGAMYEDIEIKGRTVRIFHDLYDFVKDVNFSNFKTTTRPRKAPFVDVIYPIEDDRLSTNPDDYIRYQDGKFGVDPADFNESRGLKFIWVCFNGCNGQTENYIRDEAVEDPVYLIYRKEAGKHGYVTDGKAYETREYAETTITFSENNELSEPVNLVFEELFNNPQALAIALEQVAADLRLGWERGEVPVKWSLQKAELKMI